MTDLVIGSKVALVVAGTIAAVAASVGVGIVGAYVLDRVTSRFRRGG